MPRDPKKPTGLLTDYVVTVRMDHFVVVKAADEEQAGERAMKAAKSQWGAGLNPTVEEVEET